MKNITLRELEILATSRMLCDKLIDYRTYRLREKYSYADALKCASYAMSDILIEQKLNTTFWPRIRRNRLYLFYLPKNRIGIEIGVLAMPGEIRFIGYKGKFPPKTLAGLVEILNRNGGKNGVQKTHRLKEARQ